MRADRRRRDALQPRAEGRDDVAPVGLELGFLVAVHEIQVELVDAGLGELVQLGDVLLGRPEQAEPVGHVVADERRVGRSDLRVMEVVIALAIADVAGQGCRQLLARVLVDEVDDVVRDERREPAGPLAPDLARADVACRGRLDGDRRRIAAGSGGSLADLADEPADEIGVGQLEDDPVGHATGHRQGHRTVAGDPHRERPAAGPREVEVGPLVGDRASLDEGLDDDDRLFEGGHRGGRLAEHATGGVPAPDAEIHPATRHLVEDRKGRCRHRRFAGRRIRDACPEPEPRRGLGHQGQQDVRLAPQHVRIEQPAVVEPGRLGLAGQGKGALERVIGLEREPELHVPTLPPGKWSGSAVLLQTAEPDGW